MGLGEALYQQFELGNLPVTHLLIDQLRWRDLSRFKQQILNAGPAVVVNALPLDLLQVDAQQWPDYVACTRHLAQICQQNDFRLLQLSSAQVFEAGDKKAYDETEKPVVVSAIGKHLFECEKPLLAALESGQGESEQAEHWMLLRLAWLINTEGDNYFNRYMSQLFTSHRVEVDPSIRGAPVWLDDALRVVATMVRQLLSGAENWGVFHYGSADPCTEKEFAQQIAENLEELLPDLSLDILSMASNDQQKVSAVLKCRRIRNNFGVHGRTWRQGLKARIRFWLDCNEGNVRSAVGTDTELTNNAVQLAGDEVCTNLRG